MNGHMETQLGKVTIDPEVIATYAGSVAVECFGIVGMAAVNMKDGLVKLLKKDYLTHGINVVETVKYKVEAFTGMEIKKMNIYVEGVRVID